MATLVLSTVGNALGGPVGSAIGALIGQSIDQAVLAPVRRGPRVGDLSVQTSSYGTQIPRIYGRMRVAGTVVWATDLLESEETGGAKGQPDIRYGYSVSLAVALSSRAAKSIGRIWADGKLLRCAAGDFKVDTEFRFYGGSEDQPPDPLIGSVEGIAATPAYRGIALAVFENLQLAEFGNRIPLMTFEVIADEGSPSIGSMLGDASGEMIASEAADTVIGFAAYGPSIRAAVEPLVNCYAVELFDDGTQLRSPDRNSPISISTDELGNSADGKQVSRIDREQVPSRELPSRLRLTYYDETRDYQAGEAQAVVGENIASESRQELPAVLSASGAKAVANAKIGRAWAERDRLTLRLPPNRLPLEPGGRIELDLRPSQWRVEKTTVDGFVIVAELRPSTNTIAAIPSDGGRIVGSPDVVAQSLSIALLDAPSGFGMASNDPTLLVAATSAVGWQRRPITISFGGQSTIVEPAPAKSIIRLAEGTLAPAAVDLIDEQNEVIVALIDEEQWLMSCNDETLAAGENLAALGSEIIQFGSALSLGGGRFRLSRLLRGRGGSEWACSMHAPDEHFCLLKPGTVQPVTLPNWSIGATVSAKTQAGPTTSIQFAGENVRPPMPVNLVAELRDNGDVALSWTRRSRQGFAWIDGVDAPLGEASELYCVNVTGISSGLELTATQPSLIVTADDLAALGAGNLSIEVRQVGDVAASHPAQLNFNLS